MTLAPDPLLLLLNLERFAYLVHVHCELSRSNASQPREESQVSLGQGAPARLADQPDAALGIRRDGDLGVCDGFLGQRGVDGINKVGSRRRILILIALEVFPSLLPVLGGVRMRRDSERHE